MAEPENQTLRILRDIRTSMKALDERVHALDRKADKNQSDLRSRLDNIRQAINGESVLGRYAAAEVEERLDLLEKRVTDLEKTR